MPATFQLTPAFQFSLGRKNDVKGDVHFTRFPLMMAAPPLRAAGGDDVNDFGDE